MGFTPLEGLVMATRSGTVDPGLVLWLEEHVGMPPSELASTLEHRSGLLGLAGTADMKAVLEAERAGDPDARLAVEVYLHRLRAGIAAMAAALDGLDVARLHRRRRRALGGDPRARRRRPRVPRRRDRRRQRTAQSPTPRSAHRRAYAVFVVEAREDLQIARDVARVLGDAR